MMMRSFEVFDEDRSVDDNDENPVQMNYRLPRDTIHFDTRP